MYYLSWLRNKILHNDPEVEKKQGWTTVGDLEGCVHYKVGMVPLSPQMDELLSDSEGNKKPLLISITLSFGHILLFEGFHCVTYS